MKKAFVTGGSGYLGEALLKELRERGIETTALVHRSPLSKGVAEVPIYNSTLAGFDWKKLEDDIPDVIFHAARMSGRDRKSRLAAAKENAYANKTLLKWLQQLDKPPLLVFVSGTLVYGSRGDKPADEDTPLSPISFQREYHLAEIPMMEAMREDSLPVVIARPAWIYGPGSWFDAFYHQPMLNNRKVPLYGNGENLMSFIHVEDAARMIVDIPKHAEPNSICNVFHGNPMKQSDFVILLSELSGLPVKKVPYWWLRIRFGKAIAEAFTFSLDVRTKHQWLDDYETNWELRDWLKSVIPSS